jgi:hypothetical protein
MVEIIESIFNSLNGLKEKEDKSFYLQSEFNLDYPTAQKLIKKWKEDLN